ncbi:MAG: CocE/NonD family hydrolase [Actinomycetota bacterium]
MRRSTMRRVAVAATLSLIAVGLSASFAAGRPSAPAEQKTFNYIRLKNRLSQPVYPDTVREAVRVDMADGENLYVEIVRPDPEQFGDGPWPTIMEISPYHGTLADRDGTRIFPDPVDAEGNKIGLTGYFAPRGYAVVIVDLRGTGRSTGCLDHIGQNDATDMKTVIEWAADQPWSNGRVGLTGHSYVGSTPNAAAAMEPEGLVTIVPSAGLASMYDHQFNKGVPWLLQWVGPMFAYEQLALYRDLPPGFPPPPILGGGPAGDNFENAPNPQIGCGLPNSSLTAGTGQVTGQYEGWHAERDWRAGAAAADIPIFMIHGVNDNAARIPAAEWYFADRGLQPGDKVWLGQWDHGSTNGRCGDQFGFRALHPTCRFDQFKYALHAWFDKHLMQRNVPTGPAVEVFLNGETPVNVTQVRNPETLGWKVINAPQWPLPADTFSLFPDATDRSLDFQAPEQEGSATFSTTAEAAIASVGRGRLTFTSEPLAQETVFAGLPQLDLHASVTNEITHLTATLFRERVTIEQDEEGNEVEVIEREPMNFCAIQPQLRDGVETLAPVIPGQRMSLPMQCFTTAHWVPAGQRLVLEISTGTGRPAPASEPSHHAPFGPQPRITVFTGPEATTYDLPSLSRFLLRQDVQVFENRVDFPLGPAQGPIEGNVLVPAPGLGQRVEPITAAGFEFDSEEGFDNARVEVLATPTIAADLDLFLQRAAEGGGWETLTQATNEPLDHELLTAGRLPPGHYRVLVHNWLGGPQDAHLEITFFNQNDEPGTGSSEGAQTEDVFLLTPESFGMLPQP